MSADPLRPGNIVWVEPDRMPLVARFGSTREPYMGATVLVRLGERLAPAMVTRVCFDGVSVDTHIFPNSGPSYPMNGIARYAGVPPEPFGRAVWIWPEDQKAFPVELLQPPPRVGDVFDDWMTP